LGEKGGGVVGSADKKGQTRGIKHFQKPEVQPHAFTQKTSKKGAWEEVFRGGEKGEKKRTEEKKTLGEMSNRPRYSRRNVKGRCKEKKPVKKPSLGQGVLTPRDKS